MRLLDRQRWAGERRETYAAWCQAVADGPTSLLDRLEFALISAHTPQSAAVAGWEATRQLDRVQPIAHALDRAGVLAPRVKADRLLSLREDVLECRFPALTPGNAREWRRTYHYAGLGYCKLSFGVALCWPQESPIVCLDTHVLGALLGHTATASEVARAYRDVGTYEALEAQLAGEARAVGMRPFAYQWAVWDYQRRGLHKEPDNHSHLWAGGRTEKQLPLFSALREA